MLKTLTQLPRNRRPLTAAASLTDLARPAQSERRPCPMDFSKPGPAAAALLAGVPRGAGPALAGLHLRAGGDWRLKQVLPLLKAGSDGPVPC